MATTPVFLPGESRGQRTLVRQGSQVSMRVARGSASWLSSHGRGLGPRDALTQRRGSLVGCCLWGRAESDTIELLASLGRKN